MAAFLLTLVKLSILGSVLAGLLMLVRPLIRSKAAAYYLWLLVLVLLCLPWGVTIPLPAQPAEPVTQSQTQTVPSGGTQTETVQGQMGETTNPTAPEDPAVPETQPPAPFDWRGLVTSPALWFGLWAVGAALWLGRYVWGYRRFAALVRASAHPAGEEARRVLAALDPGGRVALLECIHVHTPMLLGVVRPVIVLPRGVEADRLGDILSHELTHARRHDLLYKWLAAAVTSLHWFNPLMAVVRRQLARSCELSCDEAVTRTMDGPARRHYGETLLALAARPPRGMGVLATTLCEEKAQLKERLVTMMKGRKQGPAALAATLALAIALTGCAAISGAAPSAAPTPTPDQSALLEDGALYDLNFDLQAAIPQDLADQLLVELPEEGEDFLITVREKRSYEAAGGGDTDMGWLFTLARWDQAQYEQYLVSDGSGVDPFARKDGWYYVRFHPTDVRFYSESQDQATLEEESKAWETLNTRLPEEVKADFIARNGLEQYDDGMYFHDGCLWDSQHRYVWFRTGDWSESITLLLSQPAAQGDGGVWCVEGWMDNNYGTHYLVLPRDIATTAADYYAQLQQQVDEGRSPGLLDPLQVAKEWLGEQGYDVGAGQTELVEGDPAWGVYEREIQSLVNTSGTMIQVNYKNGQAEEVDRCTSPGIRILWVPVLVHAPAPETLNGSAIILDPDGEEGRVIVLEEGNLMGLERDGKTDWYARAGHLSQTGLYNLFLAGYEMLVQGQEELPAPT
ncbi:hypothetical protein B5G34_17945 [Flavonifractor sp. An82]|uniref:M56 family metallopeptidase n=1 Tax=Flavonifractor sp. An82 TaxID=1965660 RepID=UPI000B38A122|nr:M56 family metallopeptidase [Flavonifractor sp. An82]OUN18707.1 hypothetical protein B5G34_17945 [Flavonifractor sp. An82]